MKRNYLPAICVFILPWVADFIILGGSGSGRTDASGGAGGLLLNALYAAAPFALMAGAMRPRPRVSRALWGGAAITALLWAVYAFAGRAAEGATKLAGDEVITPQSGELFLWLFIILMIWPCVITVLMGVAAKFKEAPLGMSLSEG